MTATQAPTPGPLTAAIDMLSEARDFIDRFSDVIDGDYGASEPNAAMVMVHEINATIDHLSAPTAPVEASGETREDRLSAALIAMVEHFERVDAAPEDKAAIQAACEVWAGVKRDKALSTTPARAEAQDEWAAGEREEVDRLSKVYADATDYYVQFHRGLSSPSADKIRKGIRAVLAAHPSPPPAADADSVRMPEKWFEVAEYAAERGLTVHESKMRLEEFQRVVTPQAITALKSEGK